jgi:hypothetical protein
MIRLDDWQTVHRNGALQLTGRFCEASCTTGRLLGVRIGLRGKEVPSRATRFEECLQEGAIVRAGLGQEYLLGRSAGAA